MFHTRCQVIETTLRAIVEDQQEQIRYLYERLDREREAAGAREKDLYERALAVNQPHVYQATRSSVPALPAGLPTGLRPAPARMRPLAPRPVAAQVAAMAASGGSGPAPLSVPQPQVIHDEALDPVVSS